MNAFLTVIPLILIRFGLLSILDKKALNRAAFFVPVIEKEIMPYICDKFCTTCGEWY